MKNLFEQSRSHWVRYDRYELKTAADGNRYITPSTLSECAKMLKIAGAKEVCAVTAAIAKRIG